MYSIDRFDFNLNTANELKGLSHDANDIGSNWPVVYVINDDEEAYVGETVNVSRRVSQHLQNDERRKLTEIRIISDKTFNKSVALDLESFLIKYIGADGKYKLQNGNSGLVDYEYYERSQYALEFKELWKQLKRIGLVKHSMEEIENSELYKYSPYKSLGEEQLEAEKEILRAFAENIENNAETSIIVRGGAGTGKTILAIYLIKLFVDMNENIYKSETAADDYLDSDIEYEYLAEKIKGIEKIGLVIPQKSLQTSLKDVFKSIKLLENCPVMSPAEVVKEYIASGEKFDLLIVDEAHRLKCRNKGHLSNYRIFDECNRDLGLDKQLGNELDWITICSRNQILFRDELQLVRPCDIDAEVFRERVNDNTNHAVYETALNTQWRCQGGNDYIDYLKKILACEPVSKKEIPNYDVKLYSDCDQMINDIKALNDEYGLCRNVAGYAWPWDRKNPKEYTIDIQGHKYRWNMTYNNWITTKTAIDEIGCIHTVQGYDLNYVGVIIGRDIYYDKEQNRIMADKTNYFDQQGKSGVANKPEELRELLINIYLTLLTRGIKGTYIYVCDDELRKYMKNYFEVQA